MSALHVIRAVNFDYDSGDVVIEYVTPQVDVRDNGLVRNHALLIPATDAFDDLQRELMRACQQALAEALQAYDTAEAVDLVTDPDDEVGPYDNPLERGQ